MKQHKLEENIKISAVSYLNTKPFLYGIFQSEVNDLVDISLDIPSTCASKLLSGEVDLGLVPVAVIPQLKTPYIISDYCIGTEGKVQTVCIYSYTPIHEIKQLFLDYQSRTSVALVRYLVQNYWKKSVKFLEAKAGFENQIKDQTAALIIGDRTIGLDQKYPFVYDLGEAWKAHTGLPFVFAAWVSNKKLPEAFLTKFNQALKLGIEKRHQVAQLFQSGYPNFSLNDYYYKYIDYDFTSKKREALQLFLKYIESRQTLLLEERG